MKILFLGDVNGSPGRRVLKERLRALREELVEGMQGEAEDVPDEHIWLSLRNARILCGAIRDALCELDGDMEFISALIELAMLLHESKYFSWYTFEQLAEDIGKLNVNDKYKQEFKALIAKLPAK